MFHQCFEGSLFHQCLFQQLVQTPPPSNSSSSAMNDLVKTGNTSSIPQGPPSTTKTAVSGDATALNVSTPTTVTGQKGSQHTTGSNKNKFLNQRQQQASLNNNNTNNTASKCTSPDGDNVAESVDSQTGLCFSYCISLLPEAGSIAKYLMRFYQSVFALFTPWICFLLINLSC